MIDINVSENPSLTKIRFDLMNYIDSHEYFPDFVKDETKQVIANHFNIISKVLGLVELTYRRTYDHKDEINYKDGKSIE